MKAVPIQKILITLLLAIFKSSRGCFAIKEMLMSLQLNAITILYLKISLDQLLAVIRQLDEPARVQIARVFV